jgi:hypothetical protein
MAAIVKRLRPFWFNSSFSSAGKGMLLWRFILFPFIFSQLTPVDPVTETSVPPNPKTTVVRTTTTASTTAAATSIIVSRTTTRPGPKTAGETSTTSTSTTTEVNDAQNNSEDSNGGLIVFAVVAGVGIFLASLGIIIFRKFSVAPSSSFQNRLRPEYAGPAPLAPSSGAVQYAVYENEPQSSVRKGSTMPLQSSTQYAVYEQELQPKQSSPPIQSFQNVPHTNYGFQNAPTQASTNGYNGYNPNVNPSGSNNGSGSGYNQQNSRY